MSGLRGEERRVGVLKEIYEWWKRLSVGVEREGRQRGSIGGDRF